MAEELELVEERRAFDGWLRVYTHDSGSTDTPMKFAVYLPPAATQGDRPVVHYLSGLTCTHENFVVKAGALRVAAQEGLILVAPDTSPRGAGIPGEDESWDFGTGAGFYVDATEAPWASHYRMYSYVTRELPLLVAEHLPARVDRQGVFGHSMGGHGALVCALRNPDFFRSVSAFSPICAPSRCPWGEKAFSNYLGEDRAAWAAYDATELVRESPIDTPILIDQGGADEFLARELKPELFREACADSKQTLELRIHEGYDHSYYFVSTFMEDHLRHHAAVLCE